MLYLFLVIIIILLLSYIKKTKAVIQRVDKLEAKLGKLNFPEQVKIPEPKAYGGEAQKNIAVNGDKQKTIKIDPKESDVIKKIKPSRTREEWEALIGGKLLNRIGAFALIIAMAFFLKYAFDNNWISETARVLIGAGIGIILLLAGNRFKNKGLDIFAQGLIGAGIAILYLSVYASFNFYQLCPQFVAFILMSIVTVVTFGHSLKHKSLAVSLFGWAGGFLTPIMLSTGQSNEIGLFIYIVLLNIGILAIVIKKDSWWILEPLALLATYFIFSEWYQSFYVSEKLVTVVLFLTTIWAVFYILDIYRTLKLKFTFFEIRRAVAGFNGLVYYALIYMIVNPQYESWMGFLTVVFASVYFITFLLIKGRIPDNQTIHMQNFLSAVLLVIIATTIQFKGYTTIIFWTLEALLIVSYGLRLKLSYIWQAGLGIFSLAILKLLATNNTHEFEPIEQFTLILNMRSLAIITITLALGFTLYLFRNRDALNDKLIKKNLQYVFSGLLFLFCTSETNDYFRLQGATGSNELIDFYISKRFLMLGVVWAIYSLVFVWFGFKKKIIPFLYCGLAVLFISIAETAIRGIIQYSPIEQFAFLLNFRAAIMIFIVLCLMIQITMLNKNQQLFSWISQVRVILQIALIVLVFDLITAETKDFFEKAIFITGQNQTSGNYQFTIDQLKNLKQLTLSGVWLIYSVILMVTGIWQKNQNLRISSMVLFGITILKIFIYDLSFLETFYRIFSFFGLGLILLAVSYLYNRYKGFIFSGPLPEK